MYNKYSIIKNLKVKIIKNRKDFFLMEEEEKKENSTELQNPM